MNQFRNQEKVCVYVIIILLSFRSVLIIYIIILLYVDDRLIQGTEVISDREYRFELACNRLAVEAVKRGCTDNVTVLIVDIIKNNDH